MVITIAALSRLERSIVGREARCCAMAVAAFVGLHTGLSDFEMLAQLLAI